VVHLEDDIAHLVMGAPYLALSRPKGAKRFLARQVTLLDECFTGLEAYPEIQVEPLAFFYLTGRSLGMLDSPSLEMMMTTLNWRGVVWGGWLALMRPSADFAPILAAASCRVLDNLWSTRCALALVEGRAPPSDLEEVNALAARIREALSAMRIERTPLRSRPTDEERRVLDEERRLICAEYESRGSERALEVLRGSRLYEYSMPYLRWRRKRT
jgi:hypothetical protein